MIQDVTRATRLPALRLLVWTLDDTFSHAAPSDRGVVDRRELHHAAVALAGPGVVSSAPSHPDLYDRGQRSQVKTAATIAGAWRRANSPD